MILPIHALILLTVTPAAQKQSSGPHTNIEMPMDGEFGSGMNCLNLLTQNKTTGVGNPSQPKGISLVNNWRNKILQIPLYPGPFARLDFCHFLCGQILCKKLQQNNSVTSFLQRLLMHICKNPAKVIMKR